ncbi:Oidioi.mRNA.OKI2018_I69.PAR.g13203.t1.cds [Oikopleura dioica]|uniref:Oidioi.mRNA.OKI2018_I69.PAR.g13203.t1.cds n=1 Tax=Oikopleura dioica TaxID=34765 RepID=A0ABN7S6V7_OIKDI|nr:Oidioi.mRNA.OKI2018_I69.PAR.g13203.t1.cds [Oikopleura dioica]
MIISVSLYRASDGLPIAASTEYSQDKALIDCKRLTKGVSTRLREFKNTCTAHNRGYNLCWQVDGEIAVVVLIDSRTSQTEAFCFLKLVIDSFSSHYEPNKVIAAQRPFAFIDFDAVVESLRRKFNKAVLQFSNEELKQSESFLSQNKPQIIQPKEIKLEMGKKRGTELLQSKFQQSRTASSCIVRLPPPTVHDVFAMISALVAGALSFARGHQIATHQWKRWNLERHTDAEEHLHILTFKGTLVLCLIQVWLMIFWFSYRRLFNFFIFVLLMLCCAIEFDNRHWSANGMFILSHIYATVKIHFRNSDKRKST